MRVKQSWHYEYFNGGTMTLTTIYVQRGILRTINYTNTHKHTYTLTMYIFTILIVNDVIITTLAME